MCQTVKFGATLVLRAALIYVNFERSTITK